MRDRRLSYLVRNLYLFGARKARDRVGKIVGLSYPELVYSRRSDAWSAVPPEKLIDFILSKIRDNTRIGRPIE